MAYGIGRSKLYAAYGKEEAKERKLYEEEVALAERAREVEGERKGLFSFLGSVGLGAAFGPIGIVAGTALGKIAGERTTYRGKQAEEYDVSTGVGQFDKGRKSELEAINRDLRRADTAETWRDVVDVGISAATAYTMGGGKLTDPSNFSWTQFGGKGTVNPVTGVFKESEVGQGLFRKQATKLHPRGEWSLGEGTLWGKWRGAKALAPVTETAQGDVTKTIISETGQSTPKKPSWLTRWWGRAFPKKEYNPWN